MSREDSYRSWEVTPTWSGSLGIGPVGGSHVRYRLTGRGLLSVPAQRGWRAQPMVVGGRVPRESVYPGYVPETPPARPRDPAVFDLSFTGWGVGHGLDLGVAVSSPEHYSEVVHMWTSDAHSTANSFAGNGGIFDLSGSLIGGVGAQLIVFPTFGRLSLSPMGVIGTLISVADLVDSIRRRRITRLRQVFPTAALIVGTNWGLGGGITAYEGAWDVADPMTS
jgi:hypothetical protein